MKKFIITLVITAMAAMMIPAGAASVTTHKLGNGIYTMVIGCEDNKTDIECNTPQISIPGIHCPGQEEDDAIVETPEEDNNTPEQKPEQDNVPENKPEHDTTPENTPGQDTNTPSVDSELHQYEAEVIRLVNEIRLKNGLNRLETDTELSRVARIKSLDMKDKNYFSHTSPTYGSPFDMMKQFGISYKTAGENIAKGQKTPAQVVDGWMNSEGHRTNILNASYTHIGVGYVAEGNYWTQMFIGR